MFRGEPRWFTRTLSVHRTAHQFADWELELQLGRRTDGGVRGSTQCRARLSETGATGLGAVRLLRDNQQVSDCAHAWCHPRGVFGAFPGVPRPDRALQGHQTIDDLDADKARVKIGAAPERPL